MTRADEAGKKLAESLIESANLMYNNNTAYHFLSIVAEILGKELLRRLEEGSLKPDIKVKKVGNYG